MKVKMKTRKLTAQEFAATKTGKPEKIEAGEPLFDFWRYVEAIPAEDFEQYDCTAGIVGHVYRMADEFEHILIQSQYAEIAMVIVLDLKAQQVYGHYLLDIRPRGKPVI
jgi:hypothetical protein